MGFINQTKQFIVPTEGNSISKRDVILGCIRITKDNKKYFPDFDSELKVVIKNRTFVVKMKAGDYGNKVRSHVLRLGREAMDLLGVQAGGKLKVTIQPDGSYVFELVN
jgi:hypothetical protein